MDGEYNKGGFSAVGNLRFPYMGSAGPRPCAEGAHDPLPSFECVHKE